MKTLAIIDVAGIFHANWHTSADQAIGEAFTQTIGRVNALRQGYDHCAICLDSPPYRRKKLSDAYKAQRDRPAENMLGQYARVKQRLADDGLPVFAAPGYEADDIVATLVAQALALPKEDRLAITVISADKDLLQLVDDESFVAVFSFATSARFNAEAVRAKFGVWPAGMLELLALCGDKSDNVPGVPGVGPKTAALVVNSPEGLQGALVGEPIDGLTPRMRDLIADNKANVQLALRLIALETDAPVNFADIFAERTPKPLTNDQSYKENMDAEDAEFEDLEEGLPVDACTTQSAASTVAPDVVAQSTTPAAPAVPAVSQPSTVAPARTVEGEKLTTSSARAQTPATGTALARVDSAPFDMTLEPKSATSALALATVIFESKLYPRLTNQQAVYMVILRGRELGLTAGAALDNIEFYEGKLALKAHLIVDRAKRDPDCEYFRFVGGDDTYAEYETKHRLNPAPTRLKYTIQQAQRAGICPVEMRLTKDPKEEKDRRTSWEKRPAEMLRKTCAVQLTRIEYPSASGGLYAAEEFDAA